VLRAEGCAHPIDYHATDYAAEVRRLTRDEGVDIVLDPLGGNDWRKGLKLLRPCGRLVAFGFANLASGQADLASCCRADGNAPLNGTDVLPVRSTRHLSTSALPSTLRCALDVLVKQRH
jgi:NADPH:quinone reductase-like Zn-dependent oxidoreductase